MTAVRRSLVRADALHGAVELVALVLVCGLLLGTGLTILPLLPFAIAAATRPAVRAARALPVEAIRDARRGLVEDSLRMLVVIGATGGLGSVLALGATVLASGPEPLGRGAAIGLVAPGLVLVAAAIQGSIVGSVTHERPLATLRIAIMLTAAHPVRSVAAAGVALGAAVGPAVIGASAVAAVAIVGIGWLAAIRLGWPAVAGHLPTER
jgi:hypothetical protein